MRLSYQQHPPKDPLRPRPPTLGQGMDWLAWRGGEGHKTLAHKSLKAGRGTQY